MEKGASQDFKHYLNNTIWDIWSNPSWINKNARTCNYANIYIE